MPTLRLEITTPEAKIYSDDVDMVVVPGVEGELGILPRHIPLLTAIKPGELKVTKNGQDIFMAVGEGFVEVTQERVSVLTDMALEAKSIDENIAAEAVRRAEEAMKHPNLGHEEVTTVRAALQKSLAQLHVKRRRQS